jgi:hypothetical protein
MEELMAKVILMMAMFFFGWWLFIVSLGNNLTAIQEDTINSEIEMEMINNLDAPAAGGNY